MDQDNVPALMRSFDVLEARTKILMDICGAANAEIRRTSTWVGCGKKIAVNADQNIERVPGIGYRSRTLTGS